MAQHTTFRHTLTATTMAAVVWCGGVAWADDKPAAPAGRQPTLDELLNLPTVPKPAETTKPDEKAAMPNAGSIFDTQVQKIGEGEGDTFQVAVAEMRQAASLLDTKRDPGINTQRVQESVVRRLDQLIAELRDQQKKNPNSKPQNKKNDTGQEQNEQKKDQKQGQDQQQEGKNSAQQAGQKGEVKDGQRNEAPLSEKLAEWGNLPQKLRDELLQGMDDNYSNLYRRLTERYYRRLAEEAQ
jgi:hypothetical protein